MKRGRDDDKITGPMFPRLHVNDTEKGGPRAPPRNKMALYEQLSIPSQRFNQGVLSQNPSNTSASAPSGSSKQGIHSEKWSFPLHIPLSVPEHLDAHQPNEANENGTLPQHEQKKKIVDGNDFMVPDFFQPDMEQSNRETRSDYNRGIVRTLSSTHQPKLQNVINTCPKQNRSASLSSRQETRREREEKNPGVCFSSRDVSVNAVKIVSSNQDHGDQPPSKFTRLNDSNNASLQHETRSGLRRGDGESLRDFLDRGIVPQMEIKGPSKQGLDSPDEFDINSKYCTIKTCGPLQPEDGDKSDDASETSMVDSISDSDISPDDVVELIGQKRFWKARNAIANQQRVFAVQVFELHRLIKVQRLIAESPQCLLENAFLGKPSVGNNSPAKKLPSEYVAKPLQPIVTHKSDPEKANRKMECSAENAVVKSSIPSGENGSRVSVSNHRPYPGSLLPTPVPADPKIGPWGFHHSPGQQQWLVPVMSPSEGLIYKPYPGPALMGPGCGGGGPFGPTPIMGPGYGASTPYHQGPVPPFCPNYFPPYGMPIMNPTISGPSVDQMNPFSQPGSHFHGSNVSGVVSSNMQHPSSCNLPTQKTGTITRVAKQVSATSSPGEKAKWDDTTRNALATQMSNTDDPQSRTIDRPMRAIKVVPHNPRSATESAARIFKSIQEERKQY